MTWQGVQSIVLRPPPGRAVRHLLCQVAEGGGGVALAQLRSMQTTVGLTVGPDPHDCPVHCAVGLSFRGLRALGVPEAYLRVFSRLAPAFAEGAALRGERLGDSGASAPSHWMQGFGLHEAHVLLTLHGAAADLDRCVDDVSALLAATAPAHSQQGLVVRQRLAGQRLGSPPDESGEWVHFGLRDGLTDHRIEGVVPLRASRRCGKPLEPVPQAPGEFLLGHPNHDGVNRFSLPTAPVEVRGFFHDSTFGVLRPMSQDVALFEQSVRAWAQRASAHLGRPVGADWIKAKLCGRWPTGQVLRPGQYAPAADDWAFDFDADNEGLGCPWFAHVRRMDPRGHRPSDRRPRPLLRRGMPYGVANWQGDPDEVERGLLGLFFCADVEGQFEQLAGAWANGGPPGAPRGLQAHDPLAGQHENAAAAAVMPLQGALPLELRGFQAWTRTRGTVYGWYPGLEAWHRLLEEDYLPSEEGGPWL